VKAVWCRQSAADRASVVSALGLCWELSGGILPEISRRIAINFQKCVGNFGMEFCQNFQKSSCKFREKFGCNFFQTSSRQRKLPKTGKRFGNLFS